jgi:hypothetical protein
MKMSEIKNAVDIKHYSSNVEVRGREKMLELLESSPIPKDQLLSNIGLYIDSKNLSRILFMNHLYEKIIDVQGVAMEFGTRWGQNAALLASLRGIYEPFNRHRKIVAFDTFTGFPALSNEDGNSDLMKLGQLKTSDNYEVYLDSVLDAQEAVNPLNHLKKHKICKGDAIVELEKYLTANKETIVAFAYFDFDIYEPTKRCLEMILPRLTKGSVIGFDELNDPDSPGETLALMEVMGLSSIRLRRYRYASRVSYYVVE